MADQQSVDITHQAPHAELFPPHLVELGYRLMQVVDVAGHEGEYYIVPPLCEVPAGPFLMGSPQPTGLARLLRRKRWGKDTTFREWPQHTVTLSAYQIGTYPLTVAEFACAVRAHAVGEDRLEPKEIADDSWPQQLTHPDYLVGSIMWWQAVAYTRWLAEVTGEAWRLPTEAEWEKAARGTDGRTYPWGNHTLRVANRTYKAPVGSYPKSASPYGVQEMGVNQGEWCSSQYRPYPYRADDGREELLTPDADTPPYADARIQRVVRGANSWWVGLGIWQSPWGYRPRIAYRLNLEPVLEDELIGTRLVRGGRVS
jgi:formylglycine-generating enzyme required for sulfatase activity